MNWTYWRAYLWHCERYGRKPTWAGARAFIAQIKAGQRSRATGQLVRR